MPEFRCADAGADTCSAKIKASSEDELVRKVEEHLKEVHNVQHVTNTLKNYARSVARGS